MGRLGSTTPTIANCCGFLVAVLLLSVVGPAPPAQADFTKERKFSTDQHDDWEPHIARRRRSRLRKLVHARPIRISANE